MKRSKGNLDKILEIEIKESLDVKINAQYKLMFKCKYLNMSYIIDVII